ncbi:hypothetical protein HDU76_004532, partial [Blyttiomyces sp. JEL0837]
MTSIPPPGPVPTDTATHSTPSTSAATASQILVIPRRPNKGTAGRKFTLHANLYPMTFKPGTIYQYEVDITQTTPPKKPSAPAISPGLGRRVYDEWIKRHQPNGTLAVFDGKSTLFSPAMLDVPSDSCVYEVEVASEEDGDDGSGQRNNN